MKIQIKRAYDDPAEADGARILVDRLWPRGISKKSAKIDLWMKEVAPSTALRKWFGHDPDKWKEFQKRYRKELDSNDRVVAQLNEHFGKRTVTLVYSAKDTEHNQAVVLKDYLESRRP
jgi:uncharacterized protein YeaO (DUF488 family)